MKIAAVVVAALVAAPLSAQTAPPSDQSAAQPAQPAAAEAEPAPAPPPAPAQPLVLTAGTPITLVVSKEVNSSTHKEGESFPLTVLNDVKIGDTVVIPRGTPASAEITWRTGKGAFGKSGKLEFSLRYIDLDGRHIPVSGDYRQEGEGNTVATGVGIIAVGVLAGFITGKRARLPMGRELMSTLFRPVPFDPDGHLSAAFDSAAAMAAADASTAIGQCRAAAAALPQGRQAQESARGMLQEANGVISSGNRR